MVNTRICLNNVYYVAVFQCYLIKTDCFLCKKKNLPQNVSPVKEHCNFTRGQQDFMEYPVNNELLDLASKKQ